MKTRTACILGVLVIAISIFFWWTGFMSLSIVAQRNRRDSAFKTELESHGITVWERPIESSTLITFVNESEFLAKASSLSASTVWHHNYNFYLFEIYYTVAYCYTVPLGG